ncbi:MAG: YlxR family protein [Chloroflexi bacterium]|nr:YlxR family protein [Chloroflexota bacterium]
MSPKHVPQRTCIVCGAKKDKRLLIRIVRTPNAGIAVDTSAREQGRGAYVCASSECWKRIVKGARIEHALRTRLSDTDRMALLQCAGRFQEFNLDEKTHSAQEYQEKE